MKIKLKRKKFVFKSVSPASYEAYLNTFGDVDANAYGVKSFPDGVQFVVNALNGKPILRDRNIRYLGQNEQNSNYYVYEKDLKELQHIHISELKESFK